MGDRKEITGDRREGQGKRMPGSPQIYGSEVN